MFLSARFSQTSSVYFLPLISENKLYYYVNLGTKLQPVYFNIFVFQYLMKTQKFLAQMVIKLTKIQSAINFILNPISISCCCSQTLNCDKFSNDSFASLCYDFDLHSGDETAHILNRTSGFRGSGYEESRLLGCDAMCLLLEPTFKSTTPLPSSGRNQAAS
jgi:hypothetical protein